MAVSHEVENGVVVQDLTAWDGETDGMDDVEAAWMDHATRPEATGAVTEFGGDVLLGAETQRHLALEWSENATRANVDRIAFVSEGIEARAVSANLDVPQEIETFESVDAAVAWAGDA